MSLQNNQVVGVGSGSTIVYAVDRLGESQHYQYFLYSENMITTATF